ncbi:hypothetical protein FPZ43_16755 [Mucilaginibacter pallidiroseus]|uniref:NHL repeat-containing protein n=1 Tax=Mucilaginibacter pallidiroseus TaxID=2599295 RepID=A0A563U0F9_9SPHI|nr:hypothetical protein [Mucilaginibacter pallidiroseus]TWR25125.1 hypothetical protein FPZ43_16755 [Mucilaginibacter pallidiroseus]
MKTNVYKMLLCGFLVAITACKKDNTLSKEGVANQPVTGADDQLMVASVSTEYQPFMVKTIAGTPNVKGYQDGTGNQARFNGAWGIELTDNGDMYVAEVFTNKIRKITQEGVVTTVKIPLQPDRTSLRNPIIIKIAKDGTKNILALEYTHTFKYKVWIVRPDGTLFNPEIRSNEFFYDLAKDPYNDYYWLSGGIIDHSGTNGGPQGLIAKFLLDAKDSLGTSPYVPDKNKLAQFYDQEYPAITGIFCGYNGVKYLVVNQKHIYKLTKSGEFVQLFKNYNFELIYSVIANKDSRTLYVADGGRILSISNNKVQYLVGPHAPYDGSDGVGTKADVRVHHMALSKDENTIYFTDYAHYTIRKLILK